MGTTSPNMRSTTVATTVEATTPTPSPRNEITITVTRAANPMLTRLFISKIVESSRPGSASISSTRTASREPLLTRWRRRAVPWRARKADSELEKKAESSTRTAAIARSLSSTPDITQPSARWERMATTDGVRPDHPSVGQQQAAQQSWDFAGMKLASSDGKHHPDRVGAPPSGRGVTGVRQMWKSSHAPMIRRKAAAIASTLVRRPSRGPRCRWRSPHSPSGTPWRSPCPGPAARLRRSRKIHSS